MLCCMTERLERLEKVPRLSMRGKLNRNISRCSTWSALLTSCCWVIPLASHTTDRAAETLSRVVVYAREGVKG